MSLRGRRSPNLWHSRRPPAPLTATPKGLRKGVGIIRGPRAVAKGGARTLRLQTEAPGAGVTGVMSRAAPAARAVVQKAGAVIAMTVTVATVTVT